MPKDPLSLVQDLYAAFGRGDVPAILEMCAPDVTFEVVGRRSDYPLFGVHQGRDGVQTFFALIEANEAFEQFEPRSLHAAGDLVLALGRSVYTVKRTGKLVSSDWAHVFVVRDGLIASFREFTDSAQVAEAYRS